jgi:hypothetical protein
MMPDTFLYVPTGHFMYLLLLLFCSWRHWGLKTQGLMFARHVFLLLEPLCWPFCEMSVQRLVHYRHRGYYFIVNCKILYLVNTSPLLDTCIFLLQHVVLPFHFLFKFYFIVVLDRGTLWYLQRSLQYIKCIHPPPPFSFTPLSTNFSFS